MNKLKVAVPIIGRLNEIKREPIIEPDEPPADGLIEPGIQTELDLDRVKSISYRFRVGYADRIGLRDSMEDKIVICGNFRNKPDEDYFAIFDGHAGKEASAYCAEQMHLFLESQLNQTQGDIPHCISETYKITHSRMKDIKTESGTTSLIALFLGNELFIANAGDSRAIFCQNKNAIIVTEDHKPTSKREHSRITSIPGGMVIKNRVQGKLAVSRAIGDYSLNPYVSEIPDVFGPFNWRDSSYEFLILACDGLWDVMGEDKACEFVRRSRDPREAAVKLRDWAYDERSKDNISVVVIWFPGFIPDEPLIEVPKKPVEPTTHRTLRKNSRNGNEVDLEDVDEDEDSEDDDEDDDEEDDEDEEEDGENEEENGEDDKNKEHNEHNQDNQKKGD